MADLYIQIDCVNPALARQHIEEMGKAHSINFRSLSIHEEDAIGEVQYYKDERDGWKAEAEQTAYDLEDISAKAEALEEELSALKKKHGEDEDAK